MSRYIKKISKEEINELPIISFPGEINVIEDERSCKKALKELSNELVLGFDTESRPSFKKGQQFPISLLQLSTVNRAYLFRLNKIPLTDGLIKILSNPKVVKAGVAIRDDIRGLQNLRDFSPAGFVELVDQAKSFGIQNYGLRAIAAIVLQGRISKKAQLSNWAKSSLDDTQLVYAATDAWIGHQLYQHFTE